MPRYIDADEALRMMRNSKQDCPFVDGKKSVWDVAHDCAISCVDAAPTADVAEVKHGKWVYVRWCEFKCSECGQLSDSKPYKGKEKYCPECGAKMDGETNVQEVKKDVR